MRKVKCVLQVVAIQEYLIFSPIRKETYTDLKDAAVFYAAFTNQSELVNTLLADPYNANMGKAISGARQGKHTDLLDKLKRIQIATTSPRLFCPAQETPTVEPAAAIKSVETARTCSV